MTRLSRRRVAACAGCAIAVALVPFPDRGTLPTANGLRDGDLVFIRGKSFRSAVVRMFEGNRRAYSHVGIVVLQDGRPFIVHADPAAEHVMKESWNAVIASQRIAAAAIFRLVDHSLVHASGRQASRAAEQYWRDRLPFDHRFDLATPRELYCTELVWRAYLPSGSDLRGTSFTPDRKYLFPSDLLNSGYLREVQPSR